MSYIINYTYCIGDIFSKSADCFVNAVNCVGIQGSGIALDFRKRFNKAYIEYKNLCDKKILDLYSGGSLHIDCHPSVNNGEQVYIYQFPTMYNPGELAKEETIKHGMNDLIETLIIHDEIKTISIPPLGCGIGRLNKNNVESIIKTEINKHIKRTLNVNLWNF